MNDSLVIDYDSLTLADKLEALRKDLSKGLLSCSSKEDSYVNGSVRFNFKNVKVASNYTFDKWTELFSDYVNCVSFDSSVSDFIKLTLKYEDAIFAKHNIFEDENIDLVGLYKRVAGLNNFMKFRRFYNICCNSL